MLSDTAIAASTPRAPIADIADRLGVGAEHLIPYGHEIAKIHIDALNAPPANRTRPKPPGKLILVSATTPTRAGEGKTTTSIGLGQALTRLGESACIALREPSLGPCLGIKGGATGGGYAQAVPANRINLHFTGDFHAITTVNNLVAATIDNHIYWGNELGIDPRMVAWRRVMDMNDRSLRHIVLGLGGRYQGIPREGGFDITAASEIMAILCLANDLDDLRLRLDSILIGSNYAGEPVYLASLNITDALMALLRDALHPNLVQTLEGTPVLMHGGPFANIAHGCSSVFATRMAMHFADWAITEAGFGFDLGAEKFFDIKCRSAGLNPDAVVLVTTIRALKSHGGADDSACGHPDPAAVQRGLENLDKHIESVGLFHKRPVVALNHFAGDTEEEIRLVRERAERHDVPFSVSRHFEQGGAGSEDLARKVMTAAGQTTAYHPLYELTLSVPEKICAVSRAIYGAGDVSFTKAAENDLKRVEELGLDSLPVCIAKAPSSLSDDPALRGRPRDFQVTVRNIQINSGAGFLVVLTGEIMRMPGLPRKPLAESVKFHADGTVEGLG
ncbi:MAG: formate--tetrahydrofolate ligase [Xanthomonadales bacterium]|nr:formate--tetrahydrofolate ligase [Xanthomonadales bacterium]